MKSEIAYGPQKHYNVKIIFDNTRSPTRKTYKGDMATMRNKAIIPCSQSSSASYSSYVRIYYLV
jgi:hypothetical protein